MEIYKNNRTRAGYYALYIMGIGLSILGLLMITGLLEFANNGPLEGIFLFIIGVSFFAGIEWYFRHYIYRIELLENHFRITTRSIFGIRTEEGKLRNCNSLEEFFTFLKFLSKFSTHTVTADGKFYIMEPSERRYILDTTYDYQIRNKLERAIKKVDGKKTR